jgi:guanylate kinase
LKLRNGILVVVSSPSGGGKTTVIRHLLKDKSLPYVFSVSMTTRAKRRGEKDGKDYWFVSEDEFREKVISNELVECEKVHNYFYGTPKEPLERWQSEGKVVLLDLDVNGAMAIKRLYPDSSLTIFLKPKHLDVLKQRLLKRATEDDRELNVRMSRVELEMKIGESFDYSVVNDVLHETVRAVIDIIKQHVQFN